MEIGGLRMSQPTIMKTPTHQRAMDHELKIFNISEVEQVTNEDLEFG